MKQKTRAKLKEKLLNDYLEVQNLGKSHNPLPIRNQQKLKVRSSTELNCNFINVKQSYFNVGKYKGVSVESVPLLYLKWVSQSINLNESEIKLLKKYIKQKSK